ncbi:MAG TPA: dihydrolipoyl dehydrogenase [Tissierellaceae bacterium]|nr:dihydrolipoyl dehydrogenase [Tissierellaceae bacterium]
MKEYDVLILGGGPGGYVAAIKAAQLGAQVAVIERDELGGICLNWGCIPTKAMLKTAKLYEDILDSQDFGISGIEKDSIRIDWKQLLRRKDRVVKRLVTGIHSLFKKNKIDLYKGTGTVINKNEIRVGNQVLKGKNLILATGAKTYYPKISGLEKAFNAGKLIDSKGALLLEEIPKELIIVGNNNYAVEFVSLFNALGSKVTLIHDGDRILPYMEEEMVKTLERHLKKKKIRLVPKARVKEITSKGILVESKGKEIKYDADKYLFSLGIRPQIEAFKDLGLKLDSKGFVKTNDKMETSIEGVYAIGDINGKYPLAHVASAEAIVAAQNIMEKSSNLDYKLVPQALYSFPELASVGLTEKEAKDKGLDYTTSKFPLIANGKALVEGERVGFLKIISDNEYGEIIGVHIMSNHATDMISKAVGIMKIEGTVHDLAETIHPHPTTSEIFLEAALGAVDQPIHM